MNQFSFSGTMLNDVIRLLQTIQDGSAITDTAQKNLVLSQRGLELIMDDYSKFLEAKN